MKHLTITIDGIVFCDKDVPDEWALTFSMDGASGGVVVKAEPPRSARFNLLNQLGEAAAEASRRQTEQKRVQLEEGTSA